MYSIFEKLCEENKVTPYKVSKATGVSTATLSNWKNGKYTPKRDKLLKIAAYFNVPLSYLLTGEYDSGDILETINEMEFEEGLIKMIKELSELNEDQLERTMEFVRFLKGYK